MSDQSAPLTRAVMELGEEIQSLQVSLSHELVTLLSSQLYQSPVKAIEELVVNAWDAGADACRVFVPQDPREPQVVIVFDNGSGMDANGLGDLWHIGRSKKRDAEIEQRSKRKQIGKFGIGKLATYAIANQVTYITRADQDTLLVTVNFGDFAPDPAGGGQPVPLPVRRISEPKELLNIDLFRAGCKAAGVDASRIVGNEVKSWTLVVLEELKEKSQEIRVGRLRWVLSTAMPLKPDFRLFVNDMEVVSAKEEIEIVAAFSVVELPPERLVGIEKESGVQWTVSGECLVSEEFPEGVCGTVIVTEKSIYAGKSTDLGRSHGFFIRVRGRLVNENDALFGLKPLSYQTFNRFRADLDVDDLDRVVTAPREGVEESDLKRKLEPLLEALFAEARDKYVESLKKTEEEEKRRKEHERRYVSARLVEYPTADVFTFGEPAEGAEADDSWFYIRVDPAADPKELGRRLYAEPRRTYRYEYVNRGKLERLVVFDPSEGTFSINEDHDLVKAYFEEPQARSLLEDLVTAEALLEVYLREGGVAPQTVGEVLERRDSLWRGLANERLFALEAISQSLLDSRADQHDLEVALVAAARALGFVAKHIGGAGEPDGLARFRTYPEGEKKITLEAKSSGGIPELGHLDLAGIQEHMKKYEAEGSLLVAPGYPGGNNEQSAVANRAKELRISCWTVSQLAGVVGVAEARQISAANVLDIVLNNYAPIDVSGAVTRLLEEPQWEKRALYRAVLQALRSLDTRLIDAPRSTEQVATEVSRQEEFSNVAAKEVESAIRDLVRASQGALTLRDDRIVLNASYDEIERRLRGLTAERGEPRRGGTFRG